MNQKRYAYLIGANGPQTERVNALKYAHRDAQRLAEALLAPPCAFTKAEWIIAENPQPTLAGLNRLIKQCEPSDLLLVHFSGHGNYEGQLFLVCNGTDIDDCLSSAIKVEDIKAYLDKCKARHKVLILDCCHAGGSYTGLFKGNRDIKSTLQQALGSSCAILSACSQNKTTRELGALDDGKGAGFLSWALTTACTSRFQEITGGSDALSLMDIWHWMPTALEEANSLLKPGEEKLHLPILVNEMTPGHDGEIWLTEQRRVSTSKFVPDELTRKKYLESVYKRYSSVTLPLGPAEGFSLHAVFQPLELRRDPLAAEDLDRKKRRPFLGERLEDEKAAGRFHLRHNEKEQADEKQRPVIAENGEDALTKSPQRRVVILGGPGTGKTTTLKHLTGCRAKEALTDPNAPIPIFLSLADLARSQKTLQSYLVDLVEELGIERTYAETLWKAIQTGQAFICLDSLDEVEPRHQRRQKMIEWVNAWAAESGNTWVIGSRFTEYKGGSFKHGRFAEWELLPMDHQLRLELAERLFPELQRLLQSVPEPSQSPATFVELLEDHPQAAAWGENPLLFSLAAVVLLRTGELPASRAMLYREVLDAIFETREADLVRRKVLRYVLSDLALEFYKTKGRTFSLDDLLDRLPIIRQRRHENWITEEMARRIINSGLLDILARETYSFRHQTFQEYLAAVEFAQRLTHQERAIREDAWEFAWGKRTYSRWTEVLRLMVGVLYQQPGNKGKLEAQHWLQELVGQQSTEEGDPGNLGLALALKSLAEITDVGEREESTLGQLQGNIISTWLDELQKATTNQREMQERRLWSLAGDVVHIHGQEVDKALEHLIKTLWSQNKNERDSACELLMRLGQQVPLKQLLVALNDPDARIRRAAVRCLRGQEDRVPLEHLLEALHDQDSSVREEAVAALGEQGDRVPLERLLEALYDQDENVRSAAVAALGEQGDRIPLEHLLDALHDDSLFVRTTTLAVLGEQGARVPLEHLLDALQDKDEFIRSAAIAALGRLGNRVPIEQLLDASHDKFFFVRREAIAALGKLEGRVPLEHLLDALHDQDAFVRSAAVAALGQQEDCFPLEYLLNALHDRERFVRREAVRALGKQGGRVPLEHLLDALHDEDCSVRATAVVALGQQRNRILSEYLLNTLYDNNKNVRVAAVAVLGEQGDRVPLEHLLDALHDQDYSVRAAAVAALGKQGDRVPLEHLLDALHDQDYSVRAAAVAALGKQGDHVSLEYLLDALRDKDEAVWRKAAAVLGKQRDRVPLKHLLNALHDQNWSVRGAAITALGKQGDRVPLEHLLDALYDEDRFVRWSAVVALGEQGDRVPLEFLLNALHDKDNFMQCAAIIALGKQRDRVPLEHLLDALHDQDSSVRREAVAALGKQGDRVPLEHLLDALHDQDYSVRVAAVAALGKQGDRVPLEHLLDALHDQDEYVRKTAVEALGEQGDHVPLEHLLEALHDENERVRQAAVAALGKQGDRVPIEHFLEAVGDEDKDIRHEGIKVLSKRAPDALFSLTDEAIAILNRQPAGPTLGSIAKTSFCKLAGELKLALPPILDELTELLVWPHWQVRINAARALGSIRRNIPNEAIRCLHELRRQDPVRVVREAADDALAEILSLETSIEDD